MAEQEKKGSRLLAIPHNSNGSKGLMFEPLDNVGKPITADYARLRSHFERLIEMMQIKGNSEVHRKFWPADEFRGLRERRQRRILQRARVQKEFFVAGRGQASTTSEARRQSYQFGFIAARQPQRPAL